MAGLVMVTQIPLKRLNATECLAAKAGRIWVNFGINNAQSFYNVLHDEKYKGWRLPTNAEVIQLFQNLKAFIAENSKTYLRCGALKADLMGRYL